MGQVSNIPGHCAAGTPHNRAESQTPTDIIVSITLEIRGVLSCNLAEEQQSKVHKQSW